MRWLSEGREGLGTAFKGVSLPCSRSEGRKKEHMSPLCRRCWLCDRSREDSAGRGVGEGAESRANIPTPSPTEKV